MTTLYLTPETKQLQPSVATIGFFDGVHLGHQHVLKQVVEHARDRQWTSIAITFDVHPRVVVQPNFTPELITPLEEKLHLLSYTGIDVTAVLPFSAEMAQLSAFRFMQTILKEQLNVQQLIIGYDNRFGKQSGETFEDYVRFGAELGIEVLLSTPFDTPQGRASSSTIRKMLHNGDVDVVQQLLSRPYSFLGKVVHGYQEGRKLGFPTANIEPKYGTTILPKEGVYAVQIELSATHKRYNGMLNIGNRPTYGTFKQTIEVHIFDFNEEIYDSEVRVFFIERVRDEVKFSSVEQLKEQLIADKKRVEQILNSQK